MKRKINIHLTKETKDILKEENLKLYVRLQEIKP